MRQRIFIRKGLSLRPVEPGDIDFLARWENDPDLWRVSDTLAPFSRHLLEDYVRHYRADPLRDGQLRLIMQPDSRSTPAGIADIFDIDQFHSRGIIGIFTEPGARRKGYAALALDMLAQYSSEILGLHQLAAFVNVTNEASNALFRKAGYSLAGTLRGWRRCGPDDFSDIAVYQLILH